jgi:hypothetical protein
MRDRMKNEQKRFQSDGELPQPSSRDLRGRQSVRATFKLTSRAIETMSAVSIHLGIKQKSIFDHLVEDLKALELIARDVQDERVEMPSRVQKTFVLSRRTLDCLEQAARNHQASRDALVEYSIQRLMPVIKREKEKHRIRKQLVERINVFVAAGEKILEEGREELGDEDPVFDEFARAMHNLMTTQKNITDFINKGRIIERF